MYEEELTLDYLKIITLFYTFNTNTTFQTCLSFRGGPFWKQREDSRQTEECSPTPSTTNQTKCVLC
jgi:hypothetical protein